MEPGTLAFSQGMIVIPGCWRLDFPLKPQIWHNCASLRSLGIIFNDRQRHKQEVESTREGFS